MEELEESNEQNLFGGFYKFPLKILGSVFSLFGIYILYQNLTISGAAVAETAGNTSTPLLASIALIVIGGILFFLPPSEKEKD